MGQVAGITRQGSASKSLPTTRWSIVLAAGGEGEEARAALEKLCQIYWQPAHAFVRRKRRNPEAALEVTQQFFLDVIEGRYLATVDRERGRFRNWLFGSLQYALANDWYYNTAEKRDFRKLVWLDGLTAEAAYQLEPSVSVDPARWFAHGCARAMYVRARSSLGDKYRGSSKESLFDAAIPEPDGDVPRHRLLAESLGISENTLRQRIFHMVIEFRKVFYAEIAQTVATTDQIVDEGRFIREAYAWPREPGFVQIVDRREEVDNEVDEEGDEKQSPLPDKPTPRPA